MITQDDGRTKLEDAEAAVDALDPSARSVERSFHWTLPDGTTREFKYFQEPLGAMPAQEFVILLTRVVKDVLEGKHGIDIGELLAKRKEMMAEGMPSEFTAEAINEKAEQYMGFIQGFLNIVEIVPELQFDIIVMSLGVKRRERENVKEYLMDAPQRGGLTLDEQTDLLKTFVRQNGGPIRRFLESQVAEIAAEVMALFPESLDDEESEPEDKVPSTEPPDEESPGGRPSSTSPLSPATI